MASKAAFNSSRVSSRAGTPSAGRWSKRAVYSSTAASPRAFTSARISATRVSMAASVSADQCRTRWNSASKSAAVVLSWRSLRLMMVLGGNGGSEGIDQATQRLALELQGRLVDDQARGDVHDELDLDQVVGLQRVAGG